jgi:hypothetical protein
MKSLTIKLAIIILLYFALTGLAFAEPVLYFSDLISGPKTGLGDGKGSGAIVTVWGRNLGISQGTSKVYIGNVEAAHVYYWGNADGSKAAGPADLFTYHKMQTISFSVPATATNGANTIKVKINGIDSNTLPFKVRTGNIRYSKATGHDVDGCGGWSNPCASVNYWTDGRIYPRNGIDAGDIVYIGDGVTDTGKDGIYVRDVSGTESNPIFVVAYPGSYVTIHGGIANWNVAQSDWSFSKLIVTTSNSAIITQRNMRIVANEMTNTPGSCADGDGGAVTGDNLNSKIDTVGNVKVLGNYIHDFGCKATRKLHHLLYISNRGGTKSFEPVPAYELGWNYVLNNKTNHALHIYDEGKCGNWSGTMLVHDNVVKNSRGACIDVQSSSHRTGSCCFNMPIEIYNNICINTGLGPTFSDGTLWPVAVVISSLYDPTNNMSTIKIYNNTFYGYSDPSPAISSESKGLLAISNFSRGSLEWINNIAVDTNNYPFVSRDSDSITPKVHSNNLWHSSYGQRAPSWDTAPITSNPLFVNAAAGDFRLQDTSPAIKAGTTSVNSVVKRDFLGSLRSSVSFDIGAICYRTIIAP